ncbi:MAG: glycoside hydrolase family 38 C-terminal domain-containing protein [Bacteroidota bacterium]
MVWDFMVKPLPLVRRGDSCNEQVLEVSWGSEDQTEVELHIRTASDHIVKRVRAVKGANRVRIGVRAVSSTSRAIVELVNVVDNSVGASKELELRPVRPWRVFIVHHSHLDVGYTDVQPHVMRLHMGFLDEAVAFCEQTQDWPKESRFKWTIEAAYPVVEYCRRRSPAQVQRLVHCLRTGQMELTAILLNLHAETCSYEELVRSLYDARRLANTWGFEVVSAMQSDVPGHPWSLPQLLVSCGVKYLSLAPNNHRAPIHELRGFGRPFYWCTADGHRVLVWFTDDPVHVYQEGNVLGFIDSYDAVLERLPAKLASLEESGYPFDAVHLRCQGAYADNGPPNFKVAEIARAWNNDWVWPQVRVATNREFFDYLEANYGDQIPQHSGDWPDWWADGTGSAAREMSLIRQAHADFDIAEAGAAISSAFGRKLAANSPATIQLLDREAALREMLLFDEHTWGAAQTEKDDLGGFGSEGLQWSYKSSHAYRAVELTQSMTESVLHRLSGLVQSGSYPVAFVFNGLGRARLGIVDLELPRELRISEETPLVLRDAETGVEIPYEWIPAGIHDRVRVRFVSPEVPAFGFRKIEICKDGDRRAGNSARQVMERPDMDKSFWQLENAALRVTVDLKRSGIRSIVDKRLNLELVDTGAPVALNTYIYDHYIKDDERTLNHRLILRHVPCQAEMVSITSSPIDNTLVYRVQGGEGADYVYSQVRLYHDLSWLEIENTVEKRRTRNKEGAYFCFPFNAGNAIHYTIPGGTCVLGQEQLPGALTDWLAIESGVWIEGDSLHISWASIDACLVQFGHIATVQPPRPPCVENGHIYSYVFNNLWSTNFLPWQSGKLKFRYVVESRPVQTKAGFVYFGKSATHPLIACVLPPNQAGVIPTASGQFLMVSGDNVVVESLIPAREGGILLRLREAAGQATTVSVQVPFLKLSNAALSTPTEIPLEMLPIIDDKVEVDLKPYQVRHLRMW